jgi:DNA-binding response OmpR family regulator
MRSILYVDDDLDDQDIFCEAIRSINPRIVCMVANDGKHALQLLNDMIIMPEYIFLDLNMPLFNGKELLQELRKTQKFSGVHVIMYSTSTNPKDAAECLKLGAHDFIVKPSTFREVYENLKRVIPPM